MTEDYDDILDTSGLFCPEPVMMLHGVVKRASVGDVIKVVSTDPSTTRDIPRFCGFLNHELLAKWEEGASYLYLIRKGG